MFKFKWFNFRRNRKPRKITRKQKGITAAVAVAAAATVAVYEGYVPVARQQAIDPPGVITVCYGMTNYDDPSLRPGQRFTKAQCKKHLEKAIPRYAKMVAKCIPGFYRMPESRQVSLISFIYNLGQTTVCKSSVARHLNAGRIKQGCDAMMKYVYANGKRLRGLENRRRQERKLCLAK